MSARNMPTAEPVVWQFTTAVVVLLGIAVLSVGATGTVAAQEGIDISIQPAESELTADEEAKFLLVVEGADSGVAAYDLNVTLSNATVAEITNINTTGAPAFDFSQIADDGARARFEVAMGPNVHDAAGKIVIAELTVVGTAAGELGTLSLPAGAAVASDENGTAVQYDIGQRHNATFEIATPGDEGNQTDGDDQPSDGDDGDGGDDGTDGENDGEDDGADGDDVTDGDDDGEGGSDGSGPGLGIVSALAALLAVGYLLAGVDPNEDAGND